jgi:hypothetical protein
VEKNLLQAFLDLAHHVMKTCNESIKLAQIPMQVRIEVTILGHKSSFLSGQSDEINTSVSCVGNSLKLYFLFWSHSRLDDQI